MITRIHIPEYDTSFTRKTWPSQPSGSHSPTGSLAGVRRRDGVRWGHRSGTGRSGHQIGAPALCDSIVEVIPMLVYTDVFDAGIVVCHAVARRRRRKVSHWYIDLGAYDSQRVVRGCSVIDTEQPRPTHSSLYRRVTMELCQLALVARRKEAGPAGLIGMSRRPSSRFEHFHSY